MRGGIACDQSHTPAALTLTIISVMLPSWLKAQKAIDAAHQLADTFPASGAADAVSDFLGRAAADDQLRQLNFYNRVWFASAFKWRLLDKGVAADTAREATQSLLVKVSMPAAAADHADTTTSGRWVNPVLKKRRDDLAREAENAASRGELAEALSLYQDLVALKPGDALARNNLGSVLSRLGRYAEAEKEFREALAKQPGLVDAHVNLGIVLLPRGRFEEAEGSFRRALILKATHLKARTQLGITFVQLGRLDSAREEFEKVLRIAPRHAEALFGMGTLARSEGRFAEAEELFRRALVADPQMSRAWAALAGIRKMTAADAVWLKRAQQTAATLKSVHQEAEVRYAIGKYFDDLGQYSQAFESYRQANELLKKAAVPYDARAHEHFVDDLTRVYTRESLARAAASASGSEVPIFVVGMPRSGTSLLEQILASHPAVRGAGELPFWSDLVRRREAQIRREMLAADERNRIAEEYLRTLGHLCPGAARVVDKTPVNVDHLGLIHSVFPRARILYMRRDPIDTALSCYFQHFVLGLSWSLDLSDIARYYKQHQRLFRHWREVLPSDSILEVPYEDLVTNQEHWTRTILEFAGLTWDERCLQFHKTQRPVVTSSYWQVRQSMYRDSVQRWRHYSRFIGPLRKLQKPL